MERHGKAHALLLGATLLVGCTGNMGAAQRNQPEAKESSSPVAEANQPATVEQPLPPKPTAIELKGELDPAGRLALKAGDLAVVINAPSGPPPQHGLKECSDDVEVSLVRDGGREQIIRPTGLLIDSEATLFRGPLRQRDRTKTQSILVADVNHDGHEDVMLWTDNRGGYGSASYDVYLNDPASGSFVHSKPFSELTVGRLGLFKLEGEKLRLYAKSGCCIHSEELYEVENNIPVLVERIEEDATGGKDPPKKTVWRRIDGTMQKVKE